MSDVRCPMCSKPNPEEAEACEFCGARIKPLYIGPEPEEETPARPSAPGPSDRPADESRDSDWLDRMRGDVDDVETAQPEESEQEDDESERGSTDLLGRFRGLGLAPEEESVEDDLRQQAGEQAVFEEKPPPERGSTDLLGRLSDLGLAEEETVSDQAQEEWEEEEPPLEKTPQALEEVKPGFEDAPKVLEEDDQQVEEPAADEFKAEIDPGFLTAEEEIGPDETEEDVPGWLARVREKRSEEEVPEVPSTEEMDWLSGLAEASLASEETRTVAEEEGEKTPPFVDYDVGFDEREPGEQAAAEGLVEEPDILSDASEESESLEDLFRDLESDVAEVERIAAEDEDFEGEEDRADFAADLDRLFDQEVDDIPLDEIPPPDPGFSFEEMEIEKGTSPLQDLFEELDEELQTGELPLLEPDMTPPQVEDQDVDEALEKLLDEFDDQLKQDAGFLADEGEVEPGVSETRDRPLEEIFSDFQTTPPREAQEDTQEPLGVGEVATEDEASALEDLLDEIAVPSDEGDDVESLFEGIEPPTEEELASLEEVFDELEQPSGDERIGDVFTGVDSSIGEEAPPAAEKDMEREPPSEADLAAIEKLFGEVDVAPTEEEELSIDSGSLREITGEAPDKKAVDEPYDTPGILEEEEAVEHTELDAAFEAAEIEPESLAPGSDQLAAVSDEEEFEELDEEILAAGSVEAEAEIQIPVEEEVEDYTPSWLQEEVSEDELSAARESELPHVPALILDEEEVDIEGMDEDFLAAEVSMEDMPSWLQDLGADVDDEELEGEEPELELARAELPTWLEAMRPIETFREEPEIEDVEEEDITEAAGPLAGLRGVLLAEPVVAMPRSSSSDAAALEITERHFTNTEILRQMIGEEELEMAKPEVKAAPFPTTRWIIGLLLLLAVMMPTLLGIPSFREPALAPHDLNPFISLMDSVSLGEPALLVFDYEPGFSPEMDAVAGAMMEDLIARRQPIVTLSSRSTGPLLADRMILRVGGDRQLVNGVDYVHLGFLTGQSTGIQLFAASPRTAIADGFRIPEDEVGISAWSTTILSEVQTINDFSVIAVMSSSAETARNWIEQLSPRIEEAPLVMVVSAGVEPMVRPYYEAQEPQIQGILTGLQAGIKYEVWNGTLSDATQSWNAFGTAILVAELILLAGVLYGAGKWFLQNRVRSEG